MPTQVQWRIAAPAARTHTSVAPCGLNARAGLEKKPLFVGFPSSHELKAHERLARRQKRKNRAGHSIMEVYLEDITDEMAAADGGPPPRIATAAATGLSGDAPAGNARRSRREPLCVRRCSLARMLSVRAARGGHTATRLGPAIYVFGGADRQQKYCDNVYRLCTRSLSWSLVQVRTALSWRRARQARSAGPLRAGRVIIMRGIGQTRACFSAAPVQGGLEAARHL
jgi:hypothetical protein